MVLRVEGEEYPLRADFIEDDDFRARIERNVRERAKLPERDIVVVTWERKNASYLEWIESQRGLFRLEYRQAHLLAEVELETDPGLVGREPGRQQLLDLERRLAFFHAPYRGVVNRFQVVTGPAGNLLYSLETGRMTETFEEDAL